MVDKIVAGRVEKFMKEHVLHEQVCLVKNESGKATVKEMLPDAVTLAGYTCFVCGESNAM